MLRIFFGLVVVMIMLVGSVATWLFWPLPSADFDWRSGADRLASQNENSCIDFEIFLSFLPHVDASAAEDYLDEMPLVERCPSLDDDVTAGSKGLGNAALVEQEMRSGIDREREHLAGLQSSNELFRQSGDVAAVFGPVAAHWFHSWSRYRDLRRNAHAGWLGWPELVNVSRCEMPLFYLERSDWDGWHRSASIFVDLPPTSLAWDRRREWCTDFALRQVTLLRQRTRDVDASHLEAHRRLIIDYENWAQSWP